MKDGRCSVFIPVLCSSVRFFYDCTSCFVFSVAVSLSPNVLLLYCNIHASEERRQIEMEGQLMKCKERYFHPKTDSLSVLSLPLMSLFVTLLCPFHPCLLCPDGFSCLGNIIVNTALHLKPFQMCDF